MLIHWMKTEIIMSSLLRDQTKTVSLILGYQVCIWILKVPLLRIKPPLFVSPISQQLFFHRNLDLALKHTLPFTIKANTLNAIDFFFTLRTCTITLQAVGWLVLAGLQKTRQLSFVCSFHSLFFPFFLPSLQDNLDSQKP